MVPLQLMIQLTNIPFSSCQAVGRKNFSQFPYHQEQGNYLLEEQDKDRNVSSIGLA